MCRRYFRGNTEAFFISAEVDICRNPLILAPIKENNSTEVEFDHFSLISELCGHDSQEIDNFLAFCALPPGMSGDDSHAREMPPLPTEEGAGVGGGVDGSGEYATPSHLTLPQPQADVVMADAADADADGADDRTILDCGIDTDEEDVTTYAARVAGVRDVLKAPTSAEDMPADPLQRSVPTRVDVPMGAPSSPRVDPRVGSRGQAQHSGAPQAVGNPMVHKKLTRKELADENARLKAALLNALGASGSSPSDASGGSLPKGFKLESVTTFKGGNGQAAQQWLLHVENELTLCVVPQAIWPRVCVTRLPIKLSSALTSHVNAGVSWDGFKKHVMRHCGVPYTVEEQCLQLQAIRQNGKPVRKYWEEYDRLYTNEIPCDSMVRPAESLVVLQFIQSLDEGPFKNKLPVTSSNGTAYTSWDELRDAVQNTLKAMDTGPHRRSLGGYSSGSSGGHGGPHSSPPKKQKRDTRSSSARPRGGPFQGHCFLCKKPGHKQTECPNGAAPPPEGGTRGTNSQRAFGRGQGKPYVPNKGGAKSSSVN